MNKKYLPPRKPRCYVAGKIGGYSVIIAHTKFLRACEWVAQMGYEPVNPLYNGLQFDDPWPLHMIVDICKLLRCRYVYFQKDWKLSRGAKIEHRVARWFHKSIFYEDEEEESNFVRIQK